MGFKIGTMATKLEIAQPLEWRSLLFEVLLWASRNHCASGEVCAARSHRSCCKDEAVHGRVNTMADDGLCMPERVWRSKVGKIHIYAEWRSRTFFPCSRFPNTALFGQIAGVLKSKG